MANPHHATGPEFPTCQFKGLQSEPPMSDAGNHLMGSSLAVQTPQSISNNMEVPARQGGTPSHHLRKFRWDFPQQKPSSELGYPPSWKPPRSSPLKAPFRMGEVFTHCSEDSSVESVVEKPVSGKQTKYRSKKEHDGTRSTT